MYVHVELDEVIDSLSDPSQVEDLRGVDISNLLKVVSARVKLGGLTAKSRRVIKTQISNLRDDVKHWG